MLHVCRGFRVFFFLKVFLNVSCTYFREKKVAGLTGSVFIYVNKTTVEKP